MLTRRPYITWQGLVVITGILCALVILATFTRSYEKCQTEYQNEAVGQEPSQIPNWILVSAHFVTCEGVVIDENEGILIVVSTLIIAFFTYTLWRSTSELAEFAEQQSKDTDRSLKLSDKALEAARITAGANELIANFAERSVEVEWAALKVATDQVAAARDAIRPWVFAHPWPAKARKVGGEIHFPLYLRCYGGEPATVTGIGVHCADAAPTKDTPLETVTDLRGVNIGLAPDNHCFYPENPDVPGAVPYKTPTERPFVFGYIRYRDQFETTYTSRFTVKLATTAGGTFTMETVGDPTWSRFDESSKQK